MRANQRERFRLIAEYLRSCHVHDGYGRRTIEEIAGATGMGYTSAKRYLDDLIDRSVVEEIGDTSLRGPGRPRTLYRWIY